MVFKLKVFKNNVDMKDIILHIFIRGVDLNFTVPMGCDLSPFRRPFLCELI